MSRTFRWRGRSTQFKGTPWRPCVRHVGSSRRTTTSTRRTLTDAQWRKQLLRMFGPELIWINEWINGLIETALRAVFFSLQRQPRNLENTTLVALGESISGGFWRYVWLLNSLQKEVFQYTSIHSPLFNGVVTALGCDQQNMEKNSQTSSGLGTG